MAKRKNSIHLYKIAATVLGLALGGIETWLNAGFVARSEGGWLNVAVALVVVASVTAIAALPLAERAWKAGRIVNTIGLCVFFALMVLYSFTTSVNTLGGKKDEAVATARNDNKRAGLAQEAYEEAKATKEAECAKAPEGKKCRNAKATLTEARERLVSAPAQRVEDSGSSRITAMMPFLSPETVRTYQPLLLPVCLQIGAFVMIALGLSPKGKEKVPPQKEAPNAKRNPRKRRKTPVSAVERHSNVVPLRTRGR